MELSPLQYMSCDIHTHTPVKKSSTNFRLYPFLLRKCSTNCLGHAHGYERHSPVQLHSLDLSWRDLPGVVGGTT